MRTFAGHGPDDLEGLWQLLGSHEHAHDEIVGVIGGGQAVVRVQRLHQLEHTLHTAEEKMGEGVRYGGG